MQKTIKINPELFTVGKNDKTNRQKNKSIKNNVINNSNKNSKVKQKLLDKIKNFQKNKQNIEDLPNLSTPEINNFDESLSFLENLSTNYNIQKNKTIKAKNLENNLDINNNINTNLPEEFNISAPSIDNNTSKKYGCLKNGSLPTFREWKRMTQKNKENDNSKFKLKINTENNEYYDNNNQISEREKKLNEIKSKFKYNNSNSLLKNNPTPVENPTPVANPTPVENPTPPANPIPVKNPTPLANSTPVINSSENIEIDKSITNTIPEIDNTKNSNLENATIIDDVNIYNIPKILRHTKTLKFKLGRNSKNRKIGIYIKNRETQKNIKKDFNKLKNIDINEVKKYLRKHNLINSGTSAPNDVLRELYEKAVLSGEVTNKNSNYLLNNFIQED